MKKKKLFAILLLDAVCVGCGAEKEQTTKVTVDNCHRTFREGSSSSGFYGCGIHSVGDK